jgi:ATP-dependent Lon protease
MTPAITDKARLPLLPLRDIVLLPHMVIPLFVGRPKSMHAIEEAVAKDSLLMLSTQKTASKSDPTKDDIYAMGCVGKILQVLRLPDKTIKVLIEAVQRAHIDKIDFLSTHCMADIRTVDEVDVPTDEAEALRRALLSQFDVYLDTNKKMPTELRSTMAGISDSGRLTDTLIGHLPVSVERKQSILDLLNIKDRMEAAMGLIEGELDIVQVEKKIRGRVKQQMEKSQREYYLNEQVKAIQRELGEGEEQDEIETLSAKIDAAGMSKEGQAKAHVELKKLKMMSPSSAEAAVIRNYVETLVSLPWTKKSKISKDLAKAEAMLNNDHYGLDKVKERIVEYLAVKQRVPNGKAPILCFVGPPGVGKTSLGESIARATNRKYVRMALGGVRDESEIRGHRRTYIGAMPGKIVQSLVKVGVRNPLFLLDEIDKMGSDSRGDPSAALLEVLDPAQNHTFSDHYLDIDFDLSDVMFVATANSFNIPSALLDRMEVIRLAGYTEDEKVSIAARYLLPKQIRGAGLKSTEIEVTEGALRDIVRYYTREAGVRNLDRELSRICRKVVKMLTLKSGDEKKAFVSDANIDKYLGVRRYDFGVAEKDNQIGEVTGLAWTEVGGELLTVEAVNMPGKGKVVCTGTLGDVMKESIEAARTVVRSRAARLGIKADAFDTNDVHIHMPEGATPKDGPSAGIALTTALVSIFTGIPVRADVAMTGEVTLRGEVLPIGGLKEKLLAAHRGGITTVLIPQQNEKDLPDIPENIKSQLTIVPVRWIDQVLNLALERPPVPLEAKKDDASVVKPEAVVDTAVVH